MAKQILAAEKGRAVVKRAIGAIAGETRSMRRSEKPSTVQRRTVACGEAPSDKNAVCVALRSANAPARGLVISGKTLEKVAKKK